MGHGCEPKRFNCIDPGVYDIKLRTVGGMTKRYAKKFENHKGMLWLQDTIGFEWVYLHIGNSHKDTKACLLPGTQVNGADSEQQVVYNSTRAYLRLYAKVLAALGAGDDVTIEVTG